MTPFERRLLGGKIKVWCCGRLEEVDATKTWPWCELRRQLLARLDDDVSVSKPFVESAFEPPREWTPDDDEFDRLSELLLKSIAAETYVLNDRGEIVLAEEPGEWMALMEDIERRRIALTEVGRSEVSTIFTGMPISDDGRGMFETLITAGPLAGCMRKYRNRGEAQNGHWELVALLKQTENWLRRHKNHRKAKKWQSHIRKFFAKSCKRAPQWCIRHALPAYRAEASLLRAPMMNIGQSPGLTVQAAIWNLRRDAIIAASQSEATANGTSRDSSGTSSV